MLKRLKDSAVFVLVFCPEGVAVAILGSLMELIYRACVFFKLLNSGLELLPFIGGFVLFVVLFAWKILVYFLKRNR